MESNKITRYYMSLEGCNAHGHEVEPKEDNEAGEWVKHDDYIKQTKLLTEQLASKDKVIENLKREPIGSKMCLTLMHSTMGLTTKISEGVDYIMQNTKEKQIEGSDFNYNLFYKINQMNNMLKKSLDEFYTKYNNPKN
jgi:hypothetical protein